MQPVFSSRHIVTTKKQLRSVVDVYRKFETFVFDVETLGTDGRSPLDPRTNEVFWLALAGPGRGDVIPCGHPHGRLLKAEHKEEILEAPEDRQARLALPKDDKRRQKKRRFRTVPPDWEEPPEQLDRDVVFEALEPLFFSTKRKVGHNVKFDLQSISKYYDGEFPHGPFGDTQVLQHLVNENLNDVRYGRYGGGYGLDDLCKRHFQFEYEQLGKAGPENFPFLTAARYVYLDARMDWSLWRFLRPFLEKEGVEDVFKLEMDILETLLPMEMHGCLIDVDRIAELDVEMNSRLEEIHEVIQRKARKLGLEGFNVKSNPQKQRLIYEVLGYPVDETTKNGAPSTAAKVLKRLVTKEPIIADLVEYSEIEKIHGTYIQGMLKHLDDHGRLHANFKQSGTKTGRFSCADPNLQNIPRKTSKEGKEIRSLFIAPPETLLVCGDYGQIELRLLAHFSKEASLIEAFERGDDIHKQMASAIFKVPIDEVTDAQRSTGKTANFAIVYGAGPKRILEQDPHIKNEDEARQILNEMKSGLPAASRWTWRTVKLCYDRGGPLICTSDHAAGNCSDCRLGRDILRAPGNLADKYIKISPRGKPRGSVPYVCTITGRKRRLIDIRSNQKGLRGYAERQAVNTVIQGSAADIMKMAMVRLHRAITGTDYRLILSVHDELVVESPKDQTEKCVEIVREAMEGVPLKLRVPLVADIGVGDRWSEAKA